MIEDGENEPVIVLPGKVSPQIEFWNAQQKAWMDCLGALGTTSKLESYQYGTRAPLLPKGSQLNRIIAQVDALREAQADAAPPLFEVPVALSLEDMVLRQRLAEASQKARAHVVHLKRILGQSETVRIARVAAQRISNLEEKQRSASGANVRPTEPESFLLLGILPSTCKGLFGNEEVVRERFEAYAYGDSMYTVLAATALESHQVMEEIPPAEAMIGVSPLNCVETACKLSYKEVSCLPYWCGGSATEPDEVSLFHVAIRDAIAEYEKAQQRFRKAFVSNAFSVKEPALRLFGHLDDERKRLGALKTAIDLESDSIAKLRVAIHEAKDRIAKLTQSLGNLTSVAAKLAAEGEKIVVEVKAAEEAMKKRESDVKKTLDDLAGLVLQCKGESYATCVDEKAKLIYDKRKYELYAELNDRSSKLFDAQQRFIVELNRQGEHRARVEQLMESIRLEKIERATKRLFVARSEDDEQRRSLALADQWDKWNALNPGNVEDYGAVRGLLLLQMKYLVGVLWVDGGQ